MNLVSTSDASKNEVKVTTKINNFTVHDTNLKDYSLESGTIWGNTYGNNEWLNINLTKVYWPSTNSVYNDSGLFVHITNNGTSTYTNITLNTVK